MSHMKVRQPLWRNNPKWRNTKHKHVESDLSYQLLADELHAFHQSAQSWLSLAKLFDSSEQFICI